MAPTPAAWRTGGPVIAVQRAASEDAPRSIPTTALLGARLDLLQSFVVLADTLSFTTAARDLCISPSGLSRRVAQLESIVGCRLVDRTTRRVRLNDRGRSLLPYAHAALDALATGQVSAQRADSPEWRGRPRVRPA